MVLVVVWVLIFVTAINYGVGYFVMGESPLLPEHRRLFCVLELLMVAAWMAVIMVGRA